MEETKRKKEEKKKKKNREPSTPRDTRKKRPFPLGRRYRGSKVSYHLPLDEEGEFSSRPADLEGEGY